MGLNAVMSAGYAYNVFSDVFIRPRENFDIQLTVYNFFCFFEAVIAVILILILLQHPEIIPTIYMLLKESEVLNKCKILLQHIRL